MKHLFKFTLFLTGLSFLILACQKEIIKDTANTPNELLAAAKEKTPADPSEGSKTAQSVQVNMRGISKHYQLVSEEPWLYNTWSYIWAERSNALSAFEDYFTYTTSGNPSEGQIERAKHKAFQDNKCNFWFGNPLIPVVFFSGTDMNKSVNVTPLPDTYAPKTGWLRETLNGRTIDVQVSNIFIASASYIEKAKATNGWMKKYSFTMRNEDMTSRLSGLKIELLHNGQVIETRYPEHMLEDNINWHYEINAGIYGNPDVFYAFNSGLGSDKSVKAIQTGEGDDFPGNDFSGGTRAAIANQLFQGLTLEGNYSVQISGVIKGNSFSNDRSFVISQEIISGEECHEEPHH